MGVIMNVRTSALVFSEGVFPTFTVQFLTALCLVFIVLFFQTGVYGYSTQNEGLGDLD